MALRAVKQVIYGVFFLLIMGSVVTGLVLAFKPEPTCLDGRRNQGEEEIDCGGPCRPCGEENQIIISEEKIFPYQRIGRTSLYVVFSNHSVNYWVPNFKYEIRFYDEYNVLIDVIRRSSLLSPAAITDKGLVPGITRAIIPAANIAPDNIARINIKIINESWEDISTYVDSRLIVEDIKFTRNDGRVMISGVVRNTSFLEAESSIVGTVFRNRAGEIIGVSSSPTGSIPPFSMKNFEIFWHSEEEVFLDMNKTEIFAERR